MTVPAPLIVLARERRDACNPRKLINLAEGEEMRNGVEVMSNFFFAPRVHLAFDREKKYQSPPARTLPENTVDMG